MKSVVDRFWSYVERNGPEECWPWRGYTRDTGYGIISVEGRGVYAHRFAYTLLVGPIPEGMTLDHYRMNQGPRHAPCSRVCVNPAHLEVTTRGENTLRGAAPSAQAARKTHCPKGHDYVVRFESGERKRKCLVCRAQGAKQYRLRVKTENLPTASLEAN